MRAAVVVEADPVGDNAVCVLDALEAMSMNALLCERSDNLLDRPVLLGAVRRDELLLQAIAADDGREVATGDDQPVVRSQKELRLDPAESTKPGDQGMLKGSACHGCLSGPRQVPARKHACVAVDHQRQRGSAILSGPDARQISGPTFIRCRGDRRHSPDAGAHAHRPLADPLPGRRIRRMLPRGGQPLSWKIRCTVFLLKPRSHATVR